MAKTYYDLLDVSANAEAEVIKAAFEAKRKYFLEHEIFPFDEKYVKAVRAFQCLSDPKRRKNYDEKLKKIKCSENTNTFASQKVKDDENDAKYTHFNTYSAPTKEKSWYEEHKIKLWVWVSISVVAVILSFAIPSNHGTWTKVDHAETFHDETYYTAVRDDINHCANGEDWTDCTNTLVDNYNSVCTMEHETTGWDICDSQSTEIEDMKKKAHSGVCSRAYYHGDCVVKDGTFNGVKKVSNTRKVSNKDEVLHTASCYYNIWGIKWGECQ